MTIKHVTRNSVCRLAGVPEDNRSGILQPACGNIRVFLYSDCVIITMDLVYHTAGELIPKVTCSACKVEIDRALDYGAVRTLKLEE